MKIGIAFGAAARKLHRGAGNGKLHHGELTTPEHQYAMDFADETDCHKRT